MIPVTLGWLAKQVKGQLSTDSVTNMVIEDITTDSRSLSAGSVFIALIGENFDGHEYALDALQKGAAALIVSKPVDSPLPQILVKDTRHALGDIARAVKEKVAPKTIGITGSSGKTTVKEMTASILTQCGKTLATAGNFNNDIGVPLTLLRLTENHRFAVIEMGANHQGEIEYTVNLAKPDVVTIVNAAASHLQGFGSLFGVARAKSEIFSGLQSGGTAVINTDSQFYEFWQGKCDHINTLSFSPNSCKGDFFAKNVSINKDGCAEFELITPVGKIPIRLRIPGAHNIGNAVLAAALSHQVGAELHHIQTGLFNMRSVKGRLSLINVSSKIRILDDTYNANVASVKAAIDSLVTFNGPRIFVFGDMGELGDQAASYHQQIGEYAKQKGVDALITIGQLSVHASQVMDKQGMHCESVDDIISQITALVDAAEKAGKVPVNILVKGSRSAKMERVTQAIQLKLGFQGDQSKESELC
ncbi:UDP-N-acetylmuramoyl-tripeptide--D-alanyl-D-alanine ligase [Agaribacter flavus]|uniref:UDP-N-acetylmuramoyl-tripeptide--D-alanyl-D-alanine ligase n=1 Tax=Agaribacter flavus TaxID=1902781 RepID=A0ABV7FNG3_9ALTE